MPNRDFDPLAAGRTGADPDYDVFVWGTVFLDIIFANLPSMPDAGTEVWADGMASCPGGIANLAVAASRLGLRTSLAASFSHDVYGDFCWDTLTDQEHVDLSRSQRFPDWHTPVTVSMSVNRDRSMVTHGHPSPISPDELIGTPPPSRAVIVELSSAEDQRWVELAQQRGALIFADVGWDPSGEWSTAVLDRLGSCHAFTPNAVEAMAYTRTGTPQEALYALADRVPLAVVTNGAEGAMAIDATTNEEAHVPALRVPPLDPTGSGDVFAAALVLGTLAGWPLEQRLSFSALCSALAIQQFGGSLAAPGWGDLVDWWGDQRTRTTTSYERSIARRYGFLDDITPHVPVSACRRASATIARHADLELPAEAVDEAWGI